MGPGMIPSLINVNNHCLVADRYDHKAFSFDVSASVKLMWTSSSKLLRPCTHFEHQDKTGEGAVRMSVSIHACVMRKAREREAGGASGSGRGRCNLPHSPPLSIVSVLTIMWSS